MVPLRVEAGLAEEDTSRVKNVASEGHLVWVNPTRRFLGFEKVYLLRRFPAS